MRPERLELEGFTAFREPVTVDFEGADLFALERPDRGGQVERDRRHDLRPLRVGPPAGQEGGGPGHQPGPAAGPGPPRLHRRRRRLHRRPGRAGHQVRAATTKEARLERRVPRRRRRDAGRRRRRPVRRGRATCSASASTTSAPASSCPRARFAELLHAEPRRPPGHAAGPARPRASTSRWARPPGPGPRSAAGSGRRPSTASSASLADASEEILAEAERRVGVLDRLVERIDEARPRLDELATTITVATAERDEVRRAGRRPHRPGRARRRRPPGHQGRRRPPRAGPGPQGPRRGGGLPRAWPRRRPSTSPTGWRCGSA